MIHEGPVRFVEAHRVPAELVAEPFVQGLQLRRLEAQVIQDLGGSSDAPGAASDELAERRGPRAVVRRPQEHDARCGLEDGVIRGARVARLG